MASRRRQASDKAPRERIDHPKDHIHTTGFCGVSRLRCATFTYLPNVVAMKELRCILFTDREVLASVLDRKRRLREALPDGQITGLRLQGGGDEMKCAIVYDQGQTIVAVPPHELQAALLAHCIAKNVPLPVDADKSIYLIRGRVALMITINFNKAARLVHVAAAERRDILN
jgi:hypothetical protein